jgi:predicted metal-dependent hydrolase
MDKQWTIPGFTTLRPRRNTPAIHTHPNDSFEAVVRALVAHWERRLGVQADYIGIRAMTSRWGSCTVKTRRIRLNAALRYCPPECVEYVVVHELAHLRESNHSPRFWAVVAAALPDYKARQAQLRSLSWLPRTQGRK